MFTIQTLNKISSKGLDRLDRDLYETASEVSNPDGIILRSFKMHDMEIPSSVKGIARAGAGTNNIPIDKCSEQGIVVFNTPGANANSVKELVLTAMLISSRKVVDSITWAQELKGKGDDVPKLVEKGKSNFAGPEIAGKTLGIVGLGAIGVLVANAAINLGMEVYGYDPFLSVDAAWGLSPKVKKANTLETLMTNSDYVTLHVPLNDKTKGIINKEKFEAAKEGLRLMNFARGGLVNNEDLKEAIKSGKVDCYVTDFPSDDILGIDKIIPVPHLGASTPEAEDNCAVMAVDQLKDFLENGNILNSVNFPACSMERGSGPRILIANKNIPNMLSQILAALADANINVDDMMNKHRDQIAYNIIDVSGDVSDEIVTKIESIEGIIKVRVIK